MAADTEQFDAIVIGTGQGGKPLAHELAGAGWKIAIVEKGAVGGTCVNVGCTPTKTMVASARVAYLARRGGEYGVECGPVRVDMAKVRQRKQAIVDSFSGGSKKRLEQADNIDLIFGEASFRDPKTVAVALNAGGERILTAEKILINTGGRPNLPPVPGLDQVGALDSTSIMELDTLPEHLLVLGGGYIGLEFGQMFRRFGSAVTVVQHGSQLLGREDTDVAEEVAKILKEDGIEILLDSDAVQAKRTGDKVELVMKTKNGEKSVAGSHLLVAAGRAPNTDRLKLDLAGVKTNARGFVEVNGKLETNVPGIYALGDVNGGPTFTHISYDDYRILRDNLLHQADRSTVGRLVPYTVYIDPQLGRIGLSERDAAAQNRKVQIAKIPMTWVARALEMDETRGLMKAIVDPATKQILGCTILGIEGGEVMSMIQIAMMGKVPYPELQNAVFAHPALSEALNTLFGSVK